MAFPKIKLCWNGSRVDAEWHLGLFGFYARGSAGDSRLRGIVITIRGLLAWLAGLAVAGYFIAAAALWFWLDRRPYNYVGYADLILPTRWSGIDKLRGQALIDEGMEDIKARKWGEGLAKLRIGIARNPDDIKGRRTLAEIFLAMKASKQAIEIYDGGLAVRYPGRDYVEAMVKSAAQSENYEWWLRTIDRALALVKDNPAQEGERRWLIQQKLAALIAADRPADALALAEVEGESGSPAISEFHVLALLKAGKPDEALAFLNEWSARAAAGRIDPQIVRLQVRAYRETGDLAGMDRALEQLRTLSPSDPRPYVYGIVQRLLAGERAKAEASLDSFLLRFGSTPQYLQMLAAPLAEIAERDTLVRLIAYARQQGFDLEPFRRFLVQALVSKGEWREAAAVMAEINANKKSDAAAQWYAIMEAQIRAALDAAGGAQSSLVSLVRGRQFQLSFYKDLISNMRKAGRPETARGIITFAQGIYPQNSVIEAWRKELDTELAASKATQVAATDALVALPKPSASATAATATPPVATRAELVEDAFMAKLEELTKAGDYGAALQHIREARLARPAWLGGREVELSRAEIRLQGRAGDLLGLRTAARLYITGDRLRSAQMIEIARELHSAGRKEEAILLLRELIAKVPDYTVAQRQLAEWSPKPAVKTP